MIEITAVILGAGVSAGQVIFLLTSPGTLSVQTVVSGARLAG
jgi:hypothetical protein